MTTPVRVNLEEFLAMEETKPYLELIDGEVVPKAMPTPQHGLLVLEIGAQLRNYLRASREGRAFTEVRHQSRNEERVYLPDLNVTVKDRLAREAFRGPVDLAPDFAIEVLSPDDRAARVLDRVQFYLRAGVRLVWIVDPESRAVFVYRPGAAPEEHRPPAVLDAKPVLADFELSLGELFAVLDEE
ncbi:MAG: hypothetical protein C0506_11490 [Anaerolinea sp.]|nr:hypothetical protein [Anaerolinea sp.]